MMEHFFSGCQVTSRVWLGEREQKQPCGPAWPCLTCGLPAHSSWGNRPTVSEPAWEPQGALVTRLAAQRRADVPSAWQRCPLTLVSYLLASLR